GEFVTLCHASLQPIMAAILPPPTFRTKPRAYITDCEHIFGYYFHHYPYFGTRGENDKKNLRIAFKLVQDLYKEEFGYYMTNIWE
ncbi:hypothetical protein CCZ00_24955, partial [Pseudomonas savastanoi pv. fraxini]